MRRDYYRRSLGAGILRIPSSVVEGRADNIKVTRPEDLALAGFTSPEPSIRRIHNANWTRFDVHAFGGEGPIIIGGVRIP